MKPERDDKEFATLPGFDPNAEEIDLDAVLKLSMRASMKARPKGKLP